MKGKNYRRGRIKNIMRKNEKIERGTNGKWRKDGKVKWLIKLKATNILDPKCNKRKKLSE